MWGELLSKRHGRRALQNAIHRPFAGDGGRIANRFGMRRGMGKPRVTYHQNGGTNQASFGFTAVENEACGPWITRRFPDAACVIGGMALPDDKERKRDATDKTTRAIAPANDRDTGAALRSVYQKTVDEQIPAEFLDLLGKLD